MLMAIEAALVAVRASLERLVCTDGIEPERRF